MYNSLTDFTLTIKPIPITFSHEHRKGSRQTYRGHVKCDHGHGQGGDHEKQSLKSWCTPGNPYGHKRPQERIMIHSRDKSWLRILILPSDLLCMHGVAWKCHDVLSYINDSHWAPAICPGPWTWPHPLVLHCFSSPEIIIKHLYHSLTIWLMTLLIQFCVTCNFRLMVMALPS